MTLQNVKRFNWADFDDNMLNFMRVLLLSVSLSVQLAKIANVNCLSENELKSESGLTFVILKNVS